MENHIGKENEHEMETVFIQCIIVIKLNTYQHHLEVGDVPYNTLIKVSGTAILGAI